MNGEPSVFTRILDGEIPGQIVHRDDLAAVICTIQPFTPGHVMVIPVRQVDHLWDLEPATYAHVMELANRMAHAIRAAYPEYPRIGMAVEGFEVPHAHVHVFGMRAGFSETLPARGESLPFADQSDLAVVADTLRAQLG